MNALKKLFAAGIVAALLSPFFYGCGSNEGNGETDETDTTGMEESGGMIKSNNNAQHIFY